MTRLERVQIRVTGRVQGVGFRASARRQGASLGMQITAENQPDGSVVMIATGTPSQINTFLTWARKGPRLANVRDIDVSPATDEDDGAHSPETP